MAPPLTLLPLTQQQQGGGMLVESSLARTQRATYAVEVAVPAKYANEATRTSTSDTATRTR